MRGFASLLRWIVVSLPHQRIADQARSAWLLNGTGSALALIKFKRISRTTYLS